MRTRLCAAILGGTFLMAGGFSAAALAGQGTGKGKATATQTQDRERVRLQQRLRDGSCTNQGAAGTPSGAMQKKGNTYGPGDGTGNAGVGPKDGTGYGAPGQR